MIVGVIDDIAHRGDRTIFCIRLAGGRTIDVSWANQAHRDVAPMAVDDPVFVTWDRSCGLVLTA